MLLSRADALVEYDCAAAESQATFRFDPERKDGCKLFVEYQQAAPFTMPLATRLLLPAGGETTLSRMDELFELKTKADCPKCAPPLLARAHGADAARARRELAEACKHSFKDCPPVVYAAASVPGAPLVSLPLREFCGAGRAPHVELVAAALLQDPLFPTHMSLSRMSASRFDEDGDDAGAMRDQIYAGAIGYTKADPLKGARFVMTYNCGYSSSPDHTCCCPARVSVFMRVSDEDNLHVLFTGEHQHAAGACKCGVLDCIRCFRAGRFPLPLPNGSAAGLWGAAMLRKAQDAVLCNGSGTVVSGKALHSEALKCVSPWLNVERNTERVGADGDNYNSLRAAEAARAFLRMGVRPPTPAAEGGPVTRLGRTVEQLVRSVRVRRRLC